MSATAAYRSSRVGSKAGKEQPFRFLSVFKWEMRKGWDVLLTAFFSEFTPEDDVELVIKVRTVTGLHGGNLPPRICFPADATWTHPQSSFALDITLHRLGHSTLAATLPLSSTSLRCNELCRHYMLARPCAYWTTTCLSPRSRGSTQLPTLSCCLLAAKGELDLPATCLKGRFGSWSVGMGGHATR